MARKKQPPVKRESSSEFFNRQTATWEDQSAKNVSEKTVNGHSAVLLKAESDGKDGSEAGLVQLVVAVAGIYASL